MMEAAPYVDALKSEFPDWSVTSDDNYGRNLGVAIERQIDGKWKRCGWRVRHHSPEAIVQAAKTWVEALA